MLDPSDAPRPRPPERCMLREACLTTAAAGLRCSDVDGRRLSLPRRDVAGVVVLVSYHDSDSVRVPAPSTSPAASYSAHSIAH